MKKKLVAAVVAFGLALGGAEAAARLFVLPDSRLVWRPLLPFGAVTNEAQRGWIRRQRALESGEGEAGPGLFDPELGWSYRAPSKSDDGAIHISARGTRGAREYADRPADDVLRVVAFGDSFTFCEEVRDEHSWPAVVESELEGVELLNFGVGGYGTDQALLRWRTVDPGERVDVVLVGLLLENIGRNVNRYRPRWYPRADSAVVKPRFVLEGEGLRLLPAPYRTRRELLDAVESGAVLADTAEGEYWGPGLGGPLAHSAVARLVAAELAYGERELAPLWADVEGEPYRVTLRVLETFHAEALARGARAFAVLVFPTHDDLASLGAGGPRYWDTLGAGLAERGIEYLDLSLVLEESAAEAGAPPLYLKSHLSPRGNAAVARRVAAWLRDVVAR